MRVHKKDNKVEEEFDAESIKYRMPPEWLCITESRKALFEIKGKISRAEFNFLLRK